MTITQADLIAKMQAHNPGMETAPDRPPIRVGDMTAPDTDCPRCSGTGWSWSEHWARYFTCGCTIPRRAEYSPRQPYGDAQ